MDELAELSGIVPPAALSALRDAPVRFDDVVDVSGMEEFVEGRARQILA